MFKLISRGIAAALILFITFGAAVAQDVSLIIGNKTYRHGSWMYEAETALNTKRSLQNVGFTVISGRDTDQIRTRRALEEFVARLDDANRVVVLLSGHFVHGANDTWFLPVDVNSPNLATVGFDGLSMNALLEMVGQKPGGASVFLGTVPRRMSLGTGLTVGIGTLNIPQGVFVATGNPGDISSTLMQDFLQAGVSVADALSNAPASIQGHGYISGFGGIVPVNDRGPVVDQQALLEQGYWQATLDMASQDAMQNYLNVYPRGAHAREARNWIANQQAQSPEDLARAAEDLMNLTRSERRKIQENLTLLGFNTRGIDAVFGPGTRAAIRDWQSARGFSSTGYLKPAQIARLQRQAAQRAAQLAEEARQKQLELEQADTDYWTSSGAATGEVRGLRRYLRRYPDGLFADLAQTRLEEIREERRRTANAADRNAWEQAEVDNNIAGYELYLSGFPDGAFADEAKARLDVLRTEEADAAVIEAARLEEESMRMNIIARILVERRLNALGLKAGNEDGNFDNKTRRALRKFQRARGFPVTGYLTRQSLVRMIAEAG